MCALSEREGKGASPSLDGEGHLPQPPGGGGAGEGQHKHQRRARSAHCREDGVLLHPLAERRRPARRRRWGRRGRHWLIGLGQGQRVGWWG